MYPGAWLWLLLTLLAPLRAANPSPAWGDWLVVDEGEPGTSLLLRRITPKSVFVAPTFNGCSEGYRQDSLGRCVKLVKVNQQAQWNFFLERLNSMYAPPSANKNTQKEAGPFHINLPIGSEGSQEEVIVKKRLPPSREESVITTTAQPTTTTVPPPTTLATSTMTVPESTTPEVVEPTTVDTSEYSSQMYSTMDSTTETLIDSLMLGDQPVSTEDFTQVASLEKPKISNENSAHLPDKPFVIIVTNEPTVRTEETNTPMMSHTALTTETSETPSTTEVTTEATTESTLRYTTDPTPSTTTEYDEGFSETKDTLETSVRPTVGYIVSTTDRPKCDPVQDDSSDCEPEETEIISNKRVVTGSSSSLPASLPFLEPNSRVRFPTESFVPVQKTQSFVRFPDETDPHKDRPSFWWPSWQLRQHPGIRGWPPSEDQLPERVVHKQYPSSLSWADSTIWRRRFFQRD